MAFTTGDNNFGTAKWIVDATAGQGTHTTIAAALTAASSGDTIFVRPGTYTENLTLKAGVNLTAFPGDGFRPNVTILGKCTFTAAGTVCISGIQLKTNADFALAVTGSAASIVFLINCIVNCSNNTGISYTSSSSSSSVELFYSNYSLGTNTTALFAATGAGSINFDYVQVDVSSVSSSSTASTSSACGVNVNSSVFNHPITLSSTANVEVASSIFSMAGVNATCLNVNGTGPSSDCYDCSFISGTASAISVGAGATLILHGITDVNSSNANAVTGSGIIKYGAINFASSSSTINTTTVQNTNVSIPAISSSNGSQAITVGSTGTVTFGAADSSTQRSNSGGYVVHNIVNNSNTAGSFAELNVQVAGTTADDPHVLYTISGSTQWITGTDNSDSDKWKVSQGTSLGTNDVIVATTAGQVTMPLQPAFTYYNSSTRSNVTGDGTVYTLIFDSAAWTQRGSGFDGTSTFTAPVTGIYAFNCSIQITGIGALHTKGYLTLVTSAGATYYSNTCSPAAIKSSDNICSLQITALISLSAAQTVQAQVQVSNSTKTISIDGTPVADCFSGRLVC